MAERRPNRESSNATHKKTGSAFSDRADRDLVLRALKKRERGETPTFRERAALKRYEKAQEAERRWAYYRTVPQKDLRLLTGRFPQQLKEVATRYGWRCEGKTTDLSELLRDAFDFLARYGPKIALVDGEDPMLLASGTSKWMERYREERARIAKLERLEREKTLLRRDHVHEHLTRLAAILRGAGETLQRQFGDEAACVLEDALDDFAREVAGWLNDNEPHDETT